MHPGLPLQAPDDHVRPTQAFLPFASADIEQSLPERFEQQVRAYPGRLAVKTRHASYTYEALHKVSECVAHAILAQRGVGEEPIAVLFEHGAQMITALLGVLKAGKFYVPLNPVVPPARLRVMLHDSQATLIVTNNRQQVFAHTLAQQTCPVLNVDALDPHIAVPSPGRQLSPDTLASLIYTSGSTGRPKGVLHNHRNVLHNIRNYTNTLHLSADDRHTLCFSTSFSASMMNIFGALLNGGALFPWDVRDEGIAPLASWLTQENITLYYSVVSVFRQLVSTLRHEEMFPALRLIHLGGEAVTKQDVASYKKYFSSSCLLVHVLALNEAATVRWYFLDKATPVTSSGVPVGYPVADKEILLLDEDGREVGVNCEGEIAIKSRYLTPGYWRQPTLTKTVFRPTDESVDVRLYYTGDRGRMLPGGCLEYLGRRDFQVKIRGQRVDPAEIESILLQHPAIKAVAVVAEDTPSGEARLVAYLVPDQDSAPTTSALRSFARTHLPLACVPTVFVLLDALPLTSTGKVDRRALPAPSRMRPALTTCFVEARTPIERLLADLWADVLGLDPVGVHDPFLDLGGDSLRAMQLTNRVRDTFHVDLPLQAFLEASTVEEMARLIISTLDGAGIPPTLDALLTEVEEMSKDAVQRRLEGA